MLPFVVWAETQTADATRKNAIVQTSLFTDFPLAVLTRLQQARKPLSQKLNFLS
jgi:hypothetical protein